MMSGVVLIAVMEPGRVTVGRARVGRERCTIEAIGRAALAPGAVSAEQAGDALRAALNDAGAAPGAVIVCTPRSDAQLKRLRLPPGLRDDEVLGSVTLQLQRATGSDEACVDFARVGVADGAEAAVLAASMPRERIAWYTAAAARAGCRLRGLTLTALGLGEWGAGAQGSVMVAAVDDAGGEIVAVERGEVVLARTIELRRGEGGAAEDARIEVARTVAAVRGGATSMAIDEIFVPDVADLSELADGADGLDVPVRRAAPPARVGVAPEAAAKVGGPGGAAIVGLAAVLCGGKLPLDFVHPTRPVDVGARVRRRALLVVLAMILAIGPMIMLMRRDLASQRRTAADLSEQVETLRTRYNAFVMDESRLNHLRQARATGIDWLAHLRFVTSELPIDSGLTLDSLAAVAGPADVQFVPGSGAGAVTQGKWRATPLGKIQMRGSTLRREAANDLRSRLLEAEVYKVESTGRDVPDRFAFDLSTAMVRPPQASEGRR